MHSIGLVVVLVQDLEYGVAETLGLGILHYVFLSVALDMRERRFADFALELLPTQGGALRSALGSDLVGHPVAETLRVHILHTANALTGRDHLLVSVLHETDTTAPRRLLLGQHFDVPLLLALLSTVLHVQVLVGLSSLLSALWPALY